MNLVLSYLKAGLDFEMIKELTLIKEETLEEYTQQFYKPKAYQNLTQYFSQQDCLDFIYKQKIFSQQLSKQLRKIVTYPVILYFLMYSLMLFFMLVLIPSLLSILSLFDIDLSLISRLSNLLFATFVFLSILNILLVLIIVVHFSYERQKLSYLRFSNRSFFSIFKEINTIRFAHLYYLLINHGFSTHQALNIMRQVSEYRLVSWISTLIVYELEKGVPFDEAINHPLLDSNFITINRLGMINHETLSLIETYLKTAQQQIVIKINRLGSYLKLFTYTLFSLLIVFMYQILLAPMSLMSHL